MKFNTIEDFIALVPNCPFCGSSLRTEFSPKTTPSFTPRYNMTFEQTTFTDPILKYLEEPGTADSEKNKMTYDSQEEDDIIVFQYNYLNRSHPIFSVEKKTNKIILGDPARVQKVIWDHRVHLSRYCDSQECQEKGNRYLSETSLMVLERVGKQLYPFHLNLEMVAITPKQRMYGLITPYNNVSARKTLLVAINKNEIISSVPIIPLYKIKSGEVITNKIRTLITFS